MVWGWTFSFSFFLSPLGVWLSSCAVGLWKEPKHFKGKIQFLVKHWGCVCNQLNLFSFVAALAFSQQPLSLFPMGSITFAFCFNFPWTDSFWQGDPHLLLMKLCLSLLLFKHIFVFKFFFLLVWPDQFVRVILLFGWWLLLAQQTGWAARWIPVVIMQCWQEGSSWMSSLKECEYVLNIFLY